MKMKNTIERRIVGINKLFTLLIVLFPILAVYFVNLGVTKLSLADTLLIVLLPFFAVNLLCFRNMWLEMPTLLLFFYCLFHYMLLFWSNSELAVSAIRDTAHFLLVLFTIAVLCPNFLIEN